MTSGENRERISRTSRLAVEYAAKLGLTTMACGQRRIASRMGIPLLQPKGRAS